MSTVRNQLAAKVEKVEKVESVVRVEAIQVPPKEFQAHLNPPLPPNNADRAKRAEKQGVPRIIISGSVLIGTWSRTIGGKGNHKGARRPKASRRKNAALASGPGDLPTTGTKRALSG